MNTCLLLVENTEIYPPVLYVDIFPIYRKCNRFLRILRYLHHKSNIMPMYKRIWLGDWKKNLCRYTEIVIFDSVLDYYPIIYIRKHNPDVRLAFCFRNRVKDKINHCIIDRKPQDLKSLYHCEIWSYSKDDCEEFNMFKYDQFFLIPNDIVRRNLPITTDCYFIGADKNRLADLIKIKKMLDKNGLDSKIEVIADAGKMYNEYESKFIVSPRPYKEVLEMILRSRCIIDVVGLVNYGMTFRCLEATVLRKKLITNYTDVIGESFYNKNNIFIIGVDNEARLSDFVLSPFDNSVCDKFEKNSFSFFCYHIFKQFGNDLK